MKKIGILIYVLAFITSGVMAQEVTKEEKTEVQKKKVEIKIKEGEGQPKIIIDGKEYDFELLELIDKDKIESVTVLKGDAALHEYDAENGVIIIKTKKEGEKEKLDIQIRQKIKINATGPAGDDEPVIIIDDEVKDKKALDALSPDDIFSVEVLKNEKAKEKYNTESGVIVIKTKKKE